MNAWSKCPGFSILPPLDTIEYGPNPSLLYLPICPSCPLLPKILSIVFIVSPARPRLPAKHWNQYRLVKAPVTIVDCAGFHRHILVADSSENGLCSFCVGPWPWPPIGAMLHSKLSRLTACKNVTFITGCFNHMCSI